MTEEILLPSEISSLADISHTYSVHTEAMTELCRRYNMLVKARKKGKTEVLLMGIIREMNLGGEFQIRLKKDEFRRLILDLRRIEAIEAKIYPKRNRPTVRGRVYLTTLGIISILDRESLSLRDAIIRASSLEEGFRHFAENFNEQNPTLYFPVYWYHTVHQVREKVRELVGIVRENMKITDLPSVRFASREAILEHLFFRSFFKRSLILARKNGETDFRLIVQNILRNWKRAYERPTKLVLPIEVRKKDPGKVNFIDIIGASDWSPEEVLPALSIDMAYWYADVDQYMSRESASTARYMDMIQYLSSGE